MQQISEITKNIGGMPASALVALVIIASFALAAYTISAVVKISKGQHRGD